MKKHEIFYLAGIFVIILSLAYFFISSSPLLTSPDGAVIGLTGEKEQIDSTIAVDDAVGSLSEKERIEKMKLLWITVPIGIFLIGAGVILKRKIEGPDIFIDRDEDDEDF